MSVQVANPPDVDRVAALYRRHVNETTALIAEVNGRHVETGAEGAIVYDEAGERYLDCGGYGVFLLGHRHPAVVAAVREQLESQPMTSRLMMSAPLAEASAALVGVAPEGLEHAFFLNAGTEAVEMAIKLARLAGRRQMVAMSGGFHGKTMGSLALTASPAYRDPFMPLLPGVTHVPYGDADALETVLAEHRGEACVVIEPVQAEAGVVVPPAGYLTRAEEICRAHDQWLVLDEIQTGLGRLGRWWGADREGVTPDLLLAGKVLSGGVVPVSAVLATPEAFAPLDRDPFLHTSTYAGAPLAMAAARATIETIESDGVVERARRLGEELRAALGTAVAAHMGGIVTDLRAEGLLIGIELRAPHVAGELIFELLERRVLAAHSLNAHDTVRFTPSAYLDGDETEWLTSAVEDGLAAVAARHGP
ncbi:MAG TPA: aminotransferase class III-fold pyridoxal phosphate-dependent enzyme [Thermoleophilaceae bacterium]